MFVVRFLILSLCVYIPHVLAGGHLEPLVHPFTLMSTVGVFFAFYLNMIGFRWPGGVVRDQISLVGKTAVVPAGLFPMLLQLIHLSRFATEGADVLGYQLGNTLVGPVFSLLIFGAIYQPSNVAKGE